MQIVEKAPAKINLGLDTLFEHPNGDKEWDMVMTSVDLADYVMLESLHTNRIEVVTDSGFLPNDRRNLAFQAVSVLKRYCHVDRGVRIKIRKAIPVAAGLGGGSSDAAAVLRGLNRMWNLHLDLATLARLGLQVDSDVPYCVYSQTAHVTGKGDVVTPLPKLPPMWIILAKPKVSVSTPNILRQVNYERIDQHPNIEALLTGIQRQDFVKVFANMGNVLEPITAKRYPEILQIKRQLLTFGADAAQMSGTGPTVFGVCRKQSRAQRVYNSLKGFCREVYLVRPVNLNEH
ncbi:4-(cytidine 5'-diphospho)-2-C-methyl-D-erythritol kinase [Lactiplantibacillus plantarum]|uniref:4-(cytidine 5'-diphospho)-2-C-methyl-D-erythritol kinase n=1 Tax=Lactiplantibacillus plantarum TaxID=1590 RepID=UPI000E093F8A|nr:4-(cytidine 5'-diphospho)-2-C-methyl-D-erythritol kinase [Lactiplantibacillus plantarum]RDG27150.1 4-(cytidine 5'-diphospho)-2-C-methyl-D-erythritol kinase [Lactiplantibacillus plantarum]